MKILYGAPGSVFVRKPRILLQEKSIGFTAEYVNPMLELSAEFKNISPLKKIPVFRDGDFTLADSSAICAYIDAKYPSPSFYPKEPEALAQALWLEEFADTALFQAVAPCYYQTVLVPLYRNKKPDLTAVEIALSQNLPPLANYLERITENKIFLVADQFTVADVAVTSVFLNVYLSGYPLSKSQWPHLTSYLDRHFKRDSLRSCISDVLRELNRIAELPH